MQDSDYTEGQRTVILEGGPMLDGTGHSIPRGALPATVEVAGDTYRLNAADQRFTPVYVFEGGSAADA